MIAALGGPEDFYSRYYINSVCPLGFTVAKNNGRIVNYNYYDSPALLAAVKPFIVAGIRRQISLGLRTEKCICLGKKNAVFLHALNAEHRFFKEIREVPHPRFIVQYQRKFIDRYIEEYRLALSG